MKLENLQTKWTIVVFAVFNNHEVNIEDIETTRKDFLSYKKGRVAGAFHVILKILTLLLQITNSTFTSTRISTHRDVSYKITWTNEKTVTESEHLISTELNI